MRIPLLLTSSINTNNCSFTERTSIQDRMNDYIKSLFKWLTNTDFDIVFIDPPYDLPNSDVEKILLSLVNNRFLKSSSIIAVERDSKTKPFSWPQGLAELKVRKYGAASIYYGEPRQ
jgi:16S rRNA G966 N2-methylase RsmD